MTGGNCSFYPGTSTKTAQTQVYMGEKNALVFDWLTELTAAELRSSACPSLLTVLKGPAPSDTFSPWTQQNTLIKAGEATGRKQALVHVW